MQGRLKVPRVGRHQIWPQNRSIPPMNCTKLGYHDPAPIGGGPINFLNICHWSPARNISRLADFQQIGNVLNGPLESVFDVHELCTVPNRFKRIHYTNTMIKYHESVTHRSQNASSATWFHKHSVGWKSRLAYQGVLWSRSQASELHHS